MVGELQPFLVGTQGERGHGVVQRIAEVEVDQIQVEFTGLDLGEVEDVVDHGQQVIGRELHHPKVLSLLRAKVGVERQLGHADDAVQGRADLVAHVGQEFALAPGRRHGGILGLAHGGLRPLRRGDVPRDAERADDAAVLVPKRHLGRRHPGDVAAAPGLLLLLADHGIIGLHDGPFIFPRQIRMLLGEEVEIRLADRLGRVAQAETVGHGLVDADEAAHVRP